MWNCGFSFRLLVRGSTQILFIRTWTIVKKYIWPKSCHNPPKQFFSEVRMRSCTEADKLKCGVSKLLDIYPAMRQLLEDLDFKSTLPLQTASSQARFEVLDLLLTAPSSAEDVRKLMATMRKAMRLHKRAYQDDVLT